MVKCEPCSFRNSYTQGGTVESITAATDSNENQVEVTEAGSITRVETAQETGEYTFQMPAVVTVNMVFIQSQKPQTPEENPQTGNMEGTEGMNSPQIGDTTTM